jgi:hypothetical protein
MAEKDEFLDDHLLPKKFHYDFKTHLNKLSRTARNLDAQDDT